MARTLLTPLRTVVLNSLATTSFHWDP
jgi:hypothetical protein